MSGAEQSLSNKVLRTPYSVPNNLLRTLLSPTTLPYRAAVWQITIIIVVTHLFTSYNQLLPPTTFPFLPYPSSIARNLSQSTDLPPDTDLALYTCGISLASPSFTSLNPSLPTLHLLDLHRRLVPAATIPYIGVGRATFVTKGHLESLRRQHCALLLVQLGAALLLKSW